MDPPRLWGIPTGTKIIYVRFCSIIFISPSISSQLRGLGYSVVIAPTNLFLFSLPSLSLSVLHCHSFPLPHPSPFISPLSLSLSLSLPSLLIAGPIPMCSQAHSIKTQQTHINKERASLNYSRISSSPNISMDVESPRRTSPSSSSPEFDFWNLSNNPDQLHPPNLLTADELFVDGVLLPLHLLSLDPKPEPSPEPESKPEPDPEPETQQPPAPTAQESSICSSNPSSPLTSSKRWKDIFKKKEPISSPAPAAEEKEKKKEKKSNGGGGGGGGAAELNINIWPFSRSRSAGTAGGRRKAAAAAAAMRKSSSAPCSRSNSRGENSAPAGRRWAASPGRAGVHVGRASPVWQVKRATKGPKESKKPKGLNGGLSGLGLNVNSCIGYRNPVGCRGAGGEGSNGGLFRIRALFSKKVY